MGLDIECELECEFGYRPECSLPLGYVQCKQSYFVGSAALGPYQLAGAWVQGWGSEALSFGSKAAKVALDSEFGGKEE